jgi:hypothetical protein
VSCLAGTNVAAKIASWQSTRALAAVLNVVGQSVQFDVSSTRGRLSSQAKAVLVEGHRGSLKNNLASMNRVGVVWSSLSRDSSRGTGNKPKAT